MVSIITRKFQFKEIVANYPDISKKKKGYQAWELRMEKSVEKWGPGGRRRPPVGVQGTTPPVGVRG